MPSEELKRLVDRTLEDDRLHAEARSVGLDDPKILDLAEVLADRLANVPLDLGGALAQRTRELEVLHAVRESRRNLLRALTALSLVAIWALPGAAVLVFWSWLSGLSMVLLVVLVAAAVVVLAGLSKVVLSILRDRDYGFAYQVDVAKGEVREADRAIEQSRQ